MIGKLIELDFGIMKKFDFVEKNFGFERRNIKILPTNVFSYFFPEL